MRPIEIITQLLELIVALAAAPLFVGWINQCRAWLQNRSAPQLWLPYRGIRKLFHKDAVIAETASRLFRLTPYIVFAAMVVAAGIIPSMGTRLPLTQVADAIALVGLLATARIFMALAAMDIGTAFGTLGARREINYACIGFALFIPWGVSTGGSSPLALLGSIPLLAVKLAAAGALLALLETVSAKLRVFRAPEFLATAFLFAVLGLLVHLLLGA